MKKLVLLAAALLVLPACFVRVDVNDENDADDWWEPSEFGPGEKPGSEEIVDSAEPLYPVEISLEFDPAQVTAGETTIVWAQIRGDADFDDMVSMDLGDGVEIVDERSIRANEIALALAVDADASGARNAILDFGDLGLGFADKALLILPAEDMGNGDDGNNGDDDGGVDDTGGSDHTDAACD